MIVDFFVQIVYQNFIFPLCDISLWGKGPGHPTGNFPEIYQEFPNILPTAYSHPPTPIALNSFSSMHRKQMWSQLTSLIHPFTCHVHAQFDTVFYCAILLQKWSLNSTVWWLSLTSWGTIMYQSSIIKTVTYYPNYYNSCVIWLN